MSGEIAPARAVAGYGARLTGAIGNRLTTDAFGTDVLLAVAGLAVTQARIIQSHDGWPYAPSLFQFLVAVAPALIAIRRVDPVLASVGLAVGAYTSLLLGQMDWVLLVGCALALWSLSSRCRTAAAAVVTAIVAIVPLVANPAVGHIAYAFYPATYYEFTDADGSSGSTGKTPPAVLDRVIGMTWPWWVSAVLLVIGVAGLAQLRRRGGPRSLATAGERFDDVRRVLGEPGHRIAVDALLAVVVASLVLVDVWHGKNIGNWWTAWNWMPYAVGYAPLTLVLRRRYPEIPVLVLAAVSLVTYWQTEERWTLLIGLSIALYSLAVLRPLRIAVPAAVVALAAPPLIAVTAGQSLLTALFPGVRPFANDINYEYDALAKRQWPVTLSLILLLPLCLGVLSRLYQRTKQARQREVVLEEQNKERQEKQVLLEGRSEIARDLHDVVAHHVNLMVIQAETGPDLAQRDLDEVLAGFRRIGDAGRRALGELDRMLSALRDEQGLPDPALTPQPGLNDIDLLAKSLSDQGLPVDLEFRGIATGVPDGIQLTAYRLVQEALTNVVKHADAETVRVLIDIDRTTGVGVRITDDGRGFDPENRVAGRHGLTGMRERVRVHDGTLTITSEPGRGTRITALLPTAGVAS